MESAIEMAGFFAAHGIWSVADGESPVIPMLAFETADGKRQMNRLASLEYESAVKTGRDWLARNPESAQRAVLIYEGFLTLPAGKFDALVLDVHEYGATPNTLLMAVPYRPGKEDVRFSVFRPKFLSCSIPQPDYSAFGSIFFRGVDAHEKGAAVWNQHIDQSM